MRFSLTRSQYLAGARPDRILEVIAYLRCSSQFTNRLRIFLDTIENLSVPSTHASSTPISPAMMRGPGASRTSRLSVSETCVQTTSFNTGPPNTTGSGTIPAVASF